MKNIGHQLKTLLKLKLQCNSSANQSNTALHCTALLQWHCSASSTFADPASECPSSFLGDESDSGEAEDDDSGHGTMSGKPTTFTEGMFCSFGVHSVDISVTVGKAYLDRYSMLRIQIK